jgi:hypothetical protein
MSLNYGNKINEFNGVQVTELISHSQTKKF